MIMLCDKSISPEIISRCGIYYVRWDAASTGETIEVALHGISSQEEAHTAAALVVGTQTAQRVHDSKH
jgi:hypothetical protein